MLRICSLLTALLASTLLQTMTAAPMFETTTSTLRSDDEKQATALLAQARQTLGGDKLARVHGLTASGIYQRELGDRLMNGEVTLDLELPDKMLRTDTMSPVPDATVVMLQGINGDHLLRNVRTPMGGPNMVMRLGPAGHGGNDGGKDNESAEQLALRNQRAELTRLTLGLLLTTPSSMSVEYAYGGQAESADGTADVIDAKGAGNFQARLFLDRQSHRPLMLTYRGVAPRIFMQTQRKDGGAGRGRESAPPEGPAKLALPAEPGEPPQVVEINLYVDDYRSVDGVLLPHHLSRSIDGKPNEDVTFKTIKINPAFKPDAFSDK